MTRERVSRRVVVLMAIAGVTEHGDDFVLSVDRDPAAD